jgi:DHA2 family multidrug resistance protein
MDTTILNVGYSDIVASFGATLDEVSWASTAYTLATITMLPLSGWFVARYGRKHVFMAIVTVFTAGSALCAMSTNVAQLAVFRLLQGAGGGLLGAISQSVFLDAYPDERRRDALNLLSVTVMLGPIAGPILAGIVLEHGAWPLLFIINVPLGIGTIWLASTLDLDQKDRKRAAPFSALTVALIFVTLLSFQFVLQSGQRLDWLHSPSICWALVCGILLGIALISQQLRAAVPMVDVGLFKRNRDFLVGNVLNVVGGASNYGIAFLGPLFLQQILGFTPLQTGLLTLPAAFAMFVGNRLQDVTCRRVSPLWVLSAGMIILGVALWFNGVFGASNGFGSITWLRVLQGFAIGLFMIPIGVLTLRSIDRSDIDSASGLNALIRQASGMAGIAVIAGAIESSRSVFFRLLAADAPRWTALAHTSTKSILQALYRQAEVLAYQRVYALCAGVMLLCGLTLGICAFVEHFKDDLAQGFERHIKIFLARTVVRDANAHRAPSENGG